jgi:NADH:ubiquinone oxidoreductase subunit K
MLRWLRLNRYFRNENRFRLSRLRNALPQMIDLFALQVFAAAVVFGFAIAIAFLRPHE